MRKSEILKLKWEQVDLKHGFIHLNITKNDERRDVPISDTLKHTLSGLIRHTSVPYVFYNPKTGNRYKDIKKTFKTALRRCKILYFRFHDLRHTFASQLVMAGVDLTTVKELMGHKDIQMTLRYAHLAPLHKANAINTLDSTLNSREKFTDTYRGNEPYLETVSH
jgi:integrase